MSVPVGGAPAPTGPALAPAPPRGYALRPPASPQAQHAGPPGWVWPLTIAAVVGAMALSSRGGYFFWDDFLFLEQARTNPFSLDYLQLPVFDHFSPVLRALTYAVSHVFSNSWSVTHLLQLGLLAAAVIAFAALARTLFGAGWTALALTVGFGQSLFLLRLLQWWTASAQINTALLMILVTLRGFLRHHSTGRKLDLAISVIALCVALLAYEEAMFVVAYLVALRLLLLEDRVSPRGWARAVWRERWVWAAYFAPVALSILNYTARYYTPQARPTPDAFLHYLGVAVAETFLPAVVGVWRPLEDLGANRGVLLAAALAVPVFAVMTLVRRPRAWRAWAFFVAGAALNTVALGIGRIGHIGPVASGHELIYQQTGFLLLLLAVGFAADPRYAGPARRLRLPRAWSRRAVLGLVGALVVYEALFVVSARWMEDSFVFPHASRAYFDRFLPQLAAARAHGGEPSVLNGTVPFEVAPAIFGPIDRYDQLLPLFDPGLRFDEATGPLYRISAQGDLVPVRFDAVEGLDLTDPRMAGSVRLTGVERDGAAAADGLCVRATAGTGAIDIPLGHAITGPGLTVRELGRLVPIGATTVSAVRVDGIRRGSRVCLRRLDVGRMVDAR